MARLNPHSPSPSSRLASRNHAHAEWSAAWSLWSVLRSRVGECLLASLALVTAYVVLGSYVAPKLLRAYLRDAVLTSYGRPLSIGTVRVHPFKLWAELNDLTLPDADGGTLLHVGRVLVDLAGADSLWQRRLVLSEIELDQPRVRVIVRRPDSARTSQTVQASDFGSQPASMSMAAARRFLPAMLIERLQVNDGRFAIVTRSRSEQRTLTRSFEPLTFSIRDVRTDAADATDARADSWSLSATTQAGARLRVTGRTTIAPALVCTGTLALTNLPLATAAKYWREDLPVAVTGGTVDLQGSYSVGLGEPSHVDLRLARAAARHVGLRAHDASAAVDIAAIEVSDALFAFTQRTAEVARVCVRGLSTRAILDPSGAVNLSSLYAPRAHEAPAQASLWTARLHSLELSDATIDLEDQRVPEAAVFHLANGAATLQDVSLDLSRPVPLTASLQLAPSGTLQARGRITPTPFALELDVRADNVALPALQPYVRAHAALNIEAGQLGLSGKLRLKTRPHAAPQLSYSGELGLRDLRTTDDAMQQELLSFKQLWLKGIQYTSSPASLDIGHVTLSQPYARVLLSAQQKLNVLSVLTDVRRSPDAADSAEPPVTDKPPAPALETEAPTVAESTRLPLRIRILSIEQMRMNFADFFSKPHFTADIQSLNGTIRNVSTDPASSAQVLMRGKLGANAPVLIEGSVQPFAYDKRSDIHMRFENIELPIFNPYSGRYAGYNISRGKLSTEIHYRLHDRALKAEHAIRIDQLVWGEATHSKSSAPLPVKLATALLRDQNGVIKLDVPVEGRLDDPDFHFWQLLWQAIKNIAAKAASAPFDFLASLFKGADQAEAISFEPGSAELNPDAKLALGALVNALAERPELRVDVPVAVARDVDRQGLARRKLRERLAERLARGYQAPGHEHERGPEPAEWGSLNDDERLALLSDVYRDLAGQAPTLPLADGASNGARPERADTQLEALEQATCALIQVADDELTALGRQRAEAIEATLIQAGKLEPARVLLSTAGKVTAQHGEVQLALALE